MKPKTLTKRKASLTCDRCARESSGNEIRTLDEIGCVAEVVFICDRCNMRDILAELNENNVTEIKAV